MPYIFSAQEAGMLAAGLVDDTDNRETQRLLTLVEVAVRAACLQNKQSVELLDPDFRGWDKNNVKTLSPCAQEVLEELSKAGYHFYTNFLITVSSEYGEGLSVPYTHTVVTWPKITTAASRDTPPSFDFKHKAVQFRQELPGDFYTKPVSPLGCAVAGSEGGDFAIGESTNENLTPVCISKHGDRWSDQEGLGADEAYFREPAPMPAPLPSPVKVSTPPPAPTPKPGNPSQLLSKLYQEGYALPGYNNDTEQDGPRPPCSLVALSVIAGLTDCLEVAHRYRQIIAEYHWPQGELIGNDMMYILQTFSLRGFEIKYDLEGGFFQAIWKIDSWDWNEAPSLPPLSQPTAPVSDPVQLELCGTEKGELSEISTISNLISLLGEQQVFLKLGLRMQKPGFWARSTWGSPGEVALFQASLNGVYDVAMVGDNNFSTDFDLDVRADELVKYFQEVGFRVTLSIEKNGGKTLQRITLGWDTL